MKVLIPCLNYADFLFSALPSWAYHVGAENVIVITSSEDQATIEMTKRCKAQLIETEAWKWDGAALNKAQALNRGLAQVPVGEVCISVDADGLAVGRLPSESDVQSETIYGCPRFDLLGAPEPVANLPYIMKRGRGDAPEACGGYFQMFRKTSELLSFGSFPTAATYDYEFAFQFPKGRVWPWLWVIHLGERGKNWSGRVA